MINFQEYNFLNKMVSFFVRFLKVWTVISLALIPALIWPYFLRAKLPSDARIGIPFLVTSFVLSFLLGFITWSCLKSSSGKSGQRRKNCFQLILSLER